jgi:hypothetical protein
VTHGTFRLPAGPGILDCEGGGGLPSSISDPRVQVGAVKCSDRRCGRYSKRRLSLGQPWGPLKAGPGVPSRVAGSTPGATTEPLSQNTGLPGCPGWGKGRGQPNAAQGRGNYSGNSVGRRKHGFAAWPAAFFCGPRLSGNNRTYREPKAQRPPRSPAGRLMETVVSENHPAVRPAKKHTNTLRSTETGNLWNLTPPKQRFS